MASPDCPCMRAFLLPFLGVKAGAETEISAASPYGVAIPGSLRKPNRDIVAALDHAKCCHSEWRANRGPPPAFKTNPARRIAGSI